MPCYTVAFLWVLVMSVMSHLGVPPATAEERTFAEDVEFLAEHVETVVLGEDPTGPRVVVVPEYQGRVMTSTARGDAGASYGWINYEQVRKGVDDGAQINVFGGEERFWLGPEGGQFSIFFARGSAFEFAAWQTPAVIDTDLYDTVGRDARSVTFQHESSLRNYSNTKFEFRIERRVELLNKSTISESLGVHVAETGCVAYRTTNRLTNIGSDDWSHESGLLSIWILGMYRHGPQSTVVIPFKRGSSDDLGPIARDDYFGAVPKDRLQIRDGVVYFAADGKHRSKIGLSPRRATPICGSFDGTRNVLTIVKYDQPAADVTDYVNSAWELQDDPYAGDVINAYNDGPPEPGAKPLGPFYELETSSPALVLKRGATGQHIQETYHFEGDVDQLDELSSRLLGVSLQQIRSALP